jgi:hypothetical protein
VLTLRSRYRPSSFHTASRWCALTLALLAASPFTAPFSTCDLGMLMGRSVFQRSEPVEPSQPPLIADAAFSLESVDDTSNTLKDMALTLTALPLGSSVLETQGPLDDSSPRHIPISLRSLSVLRI